MRDAPGDQNPRNFPFFFFASCIVACNEFIALTHQKDDSKDEKNNCKSNANYHILSKTFVIRVSMEFLYSVFIFWA